MADSSREIATLPNKELLQQFRLERNRLIIVGQPTQESWISAGRLLARMNGAVQWWIGDWLNYGESKNYISRSKYELALKTTGLAKATLWQYSWVSRKVKSSIRIEDLYWRHHELVAGLSEAKQNKWLSYALKPLNNGRDRPLAVSALRRAIKESRPSEYPQWLCYTDIWNISDCDDRFGTPYPGRIPGQIVLNTLYYFGCPGGLVIDPMAGGGTVMDVCKAKKIRCFAFDIKPSRTGVKKHDASKPWPVKEKAGLIFIDPPYGSQQAESYGGMAGLNAEQFMAELSKVIMQSAKNLKQDAHLAILIAPMAIREKYFDLPFETVRSAETHGLMLIRRIIVPVSTQQVGPQVTGAAKKNKTILAVLRDLLIFKSKQN
ncbi:MAG: hypothetical protein V3W19_04245 [Desulfatiglandales bacterium]